MLNSINKRRYKKGQSTLEYAILIIIIIGALLAIQNYIKRGLTGRLKQATDDIGDQHSVGNSNVYKKRTVLSTTNDTNLSGSATSRIIGQEITRDEMSANIINTEYEYWGK